jgi:hypothetical protein
MFEGFSDDLRRDWRTLKAAAPGERFQKLYWHRRQSGRSSLMKLGMIALGLLTAVAGLIMLVTPGPGTVALLIGLALLARESTFVARAIDSAELRLGPLASRFTRTWHCRRRSS